MTCCNIWEKFDEKNNLIKEYNHWKVLIKNPQKTLGNCVVISKRHCEAMGDLSPEELGEYAIVAKNMETALKKAFNYDIIHHLMIMFYDRHTHFHVIPRYQTPREFAGREWKEIFDPDPLALKNETLDQEVLSAIKEEIKKYL